MNTIQHDVIWQATGQGMEKTGGKAMVPSCNYINLLNKDNKNTFLYS